VWRNMCFFFMTFSNDLAIQCRHSHSTLIFMYFSKFSVAVVKKKIGLMQKKLKIKNLRKMRGKKIYLKFKMYFVSLTEFFLWSRNYDAIFQDTTYTLWKNSWFFTWDKKCLPYIAHIYYLQLLSNSSLNVLLAFSCCWNIKFHDWPST
jgi:hypothetical protein